MSHYNTRSKGKAEEVVALETEQKQHKRKSPSTTSSSTKNPKTKKSKKEPSEKTSEILEKGLIYFFYRPKIDSEEVKGINDVAKLYILLYPQDPESGGEQEKGKTSTSKKRLFSISKKKLPQLKQHGKYWGFVVKTSDSIEEIVKTEFEEKDYSTKTRGVRHLQGLRPVAEGVYAICTHGDHTHLVYVLEIPEKLGEVQDAFNIEKEGSYILSIKNPEMSSVWGEWEPKKNALEYPEEMKKVFGDKKKGGSTYRWHPANPISLLDYEGAQLLLIGAAEDIVEELGETGEYIEELEKIDAKRISDDKLFQELHLDKKKHSPVPLLQGLWK
jgi:hypothetical protein